MVLQPLKSTRSLGPILAVGGLLSVSWFALCTSLTQTHSADLPHTRPINRPIFPDFSRFFGLSWETSPQTDSTPEASERCGSGRIEFSSKSTTFLM